MQGEAKEEIRARLNIEDVISEYVQLKRAGRNFKGLSPFTSEKTPSFIVSPDKQIWHDFSSNRGGDVFSFVMEAEGLDFRAALELLARKAGVDLSLYESGKNRSLAAKKKRLAEANSLAARYFQSALVQNKTAISYVAEKRGLNREIISDFMIGYAPSDGQALVKLLEKKGFSKSEIADAGLANRFGGDLFRERMMVPLSDGTGQVIGFTGRIIRDIENAPKYLNTPQTLLYDKGHHVFGLFQARDAIREQNFAVIVEGNLDVVSSHQAGVKNVVATAGTAMTEYHLKALKRLTSDIRLCFDGDKAGIAASERAVGIASEIGVELSIISLPDAAKDPDELIKKDAKRWREVIATPAPAPEWVIERYRERYDVSTASGKRQFTSASLALVARLKDSVEREYYEQMVARIAATTLETIRAKANDFAPLASESKKAVKAQNTGKPDLSTAYQDDLLALSLSDVAARQHLVHLDVNLLAGEERQQLAKYLQTHPEKKLENVPASLHKIDTYVKIVQLKADTRYAAMSDDDRSFETARLIRRVEHEHLKEMRDNLTAELREAETAGDEARSKILINELNSLIKEIARGK